MIRKIGIFAACVFAAYLFAASAAAQSDNMIHVKSFPGGDVGTMVTNAQATCNPSAVIPCILVIDASLAAYPPGTMPVLCAQCVLDDFREPRQLGSVFQCDQFQGADVSIRFNACVAAVIAAGGGTADARKLLAGTTSGVEELDCGSQAANNAVIGVSCLLPPSAIFTANHVGGPVTGAAPYKSAAEGTGYAVGDKIYPVETGYAYTGVAAGAVLQVATVGSGGAATSFTVVTAGSGYLTSQYVTTTTSGSGTGLVLWLSAADCGLRSFGRSTIHVDSVGGGAASFQITPSAASSGFRLDADYCTDNQASIYVREDGGLRAFNATSTEAFSAAGVHLRDSVDESKFHLIEVGTSHDDNIWIQSACCSASFHGLHADAGNAGGYPLKIGSGGVLYNACTTSGSPVITVPFGNLTASYLGDFFSDQTNIPDDAVIIAINSATSLTISANATATSSGQSACSSHTVTGGSGLRLRMDDTNYGNGVTAVGVYDAVANSPGPGLQNIDIEETSDLKLDGIYGESNGPVDAYTPTVFQDQTASGTLFEHMSIGATSSYPNKLSLESVSQYDWCAFSWATEQGFTDNGSAVLPRAQGNNNPLNYCRGGFLPSSNQRQFSTYCTGTAASSQTGLSMWGLGASTTACTGIYSSSYGTVMTNSGTLSMLTVRCGTSGVSSSSGVFSLIDLSQGGTTTSTGLTVTYGQTTARDVVQDTTHTYTYSTGDLIYLLYTTQASETLGNCSLSFLY